MIKKTPKTLVGSELVIFWITSSWFNEGNLRSWIVVWEYTSQNFTMDLTDFTNFFRWYPKPNNLCRKPRKNSHSSRPTLESSYQPSAQVDSHLRFRTNGSSWLADKFTFCLNPGTSEYDGRSDWLGKKKGILKTFMNLNFFTNFR